MIYPARQARLEAGYTAAAAARRLGFGAAHLRDLERHPRKWTWSKALRAARLYGVPVQVVYWQPQPDGSPSWQTLARGTGAAAGPPPPESAGDRLAQTLSPDP